VVQKLLRKITQKLKKIAFSKSKDSKSESSESPISEKRKTSYTKVEDSKDNHETKQKKRRVRKKRNKRLIDKPSSEVISEIKKDSLIADDKIAISEHENWDISQFNVPEKEGHIRFHDLNIDSRILHAIADLKFEYCTPIPG